MQCDSTPSSQVVCVHISCVCVCVHVCMCACDVLALSCVLHVQISHACHNTLCGHNIIAAASASLISRLPSTHDEVGKSHHWEQSCEV